MAQRKFRVLRGDKDRGEFVDYIVEVDEGMVILDGLFNVQAQHANDMPMTWPSDGIAKPGNVAPAVWKSMANPNWRV